MADVTDALARVPLFSQVGKRDLKRLERRMTDRSFKDGDMVTEEGKTGLGFFVIEDGGVAVSVLGEVVRTLGPGEYFGEIALIDEGPRSATVTATGDLRCRAMAAWEFRSFVQEHPEVAWQLLQTLAARFREAEARAAS